MNPCLGEDEIKARRQNQPHHATQRSRSQKKSRPRNNRHPARNLHATRTQAHFPRNGNRQNSTQQQGVNKDIQNTDLDRQSLSYCVSLIENGVNPEALAVSLSLPLPLPLHPYYVRVCYFEIELTG
jgi:hypothetical protein